MDVQAALRAAVKANKPAMAIAVKGELKNGVVVEVPGFVVDYPGGVLRGPVGSSRVDLQACKLEYSIVSPK